MRKKLTEKQNKLLETFAIIMLIVFALISYFITNLINGNKEEIRNVVIYVNGEKITHVNGEIIDINIDKTFTLGDATYEYNTIEIKDKQIRCVDSNCRDKICVNHGYLNPEVDNDMIVCAPHRLIIAYQ